MGFECERTWPLSQKKTLNRQGRNGTQSCRRRGDAPLSQKQGMSNIFTPWTRHGMAWSYNLLIFSETIAME
jgi:hypothetical protein